MVGSLVIPLTIAIDLSIRKHLEALTIEGKPDSPVYPQVQFIWRNRGDITKIT